MTKQDYSYSGTTTSCYFDAPFNLLETLVPQAQAILITDEHVFEHHPLLFAHWKTIVIKAGEVHKQQETVDYIIEQLIKLEADRSYWIVGVGGGVVTDIAGYVGGIYMRGLNVGFVPTTILAMVDAAIGGKNGVDVGVYKNITGLIRQPQFLLYDYSLLATLPESEWVNGFAEIIKHGAIKDRQMFDDLKVNSLSYYQTHHDALATLIQRNVEIKSTVVMHDEREQGERKLLNFGHTIGHAIENMYQLPHGHAISIGMVAAASIAEEIANFSSDEKQQLIQLLQQYKLPIQHNVDIEKLFQILRMDKKRQKDAVHFILLEQIGKAVIQSIPLVQLEQLLPMVME
ncbi:MAG: 3-dehydroquinate synthase [Ferruginibacter sp.]